MAGAPNPMMTALAPMIMQRLAALRSGGGGGGPMDGPGGPGTGPSGSPSDDMASAGFGRELSSARQADPGALVKSIGQIKQQILEMINQVGMSSPGVARALAKTLQGLDAGMKEAADAAATLQVAQPINASAAQGAPGGSGPMPPGMPGVGSF